MKATAKFNSSNEVCQRFTGCDGLDVQEYSKWVNNLSDADFVAWNRLLRREWRVKLRAATTDVERQKCRITIGRLDQMLREMRVGRRYRPSLHARSIHTQVIDGEVCQLATHAISIPIFPQGKTREVQMRPRINEKVFQQLGLTPDELIIARERVARHQKEEEESGGAGTLTALFKQISAAADALSNGDTTAAKRALVKIGVLAARLRDVNGGGVATGRAFGGDAGPVDEGGDVSNRPTAWSSKHARILR